MGSQTKAPVSLKVTEHWPTGLLNWGFTCHLESSQITGNSHQPLFPRLFGISISFTIPFSTIFSANDERGGQQAEAPLRDASEEMKKGNEDVPQ